MRPAFLSVFALAATIFLAAPSAAGQTFSDSFDAAPSPQWDNQRGNWGVVNGEYHAQAPGNSPLTFTSLPFELTDFDLELDVKAVTDGGIWLRTDAAGQNGVLLVTGGFGGSGTGLYWHTIQNGGPAATFGSTSGLFAQGDDIHLRITVRGDWYAAYLNGSPIPTTQMTTSLFPSGRIGLYDSSATGQRFDNVSLSPPSDISVFEEGDIVIASDGAFHIFRDGALMPLLQRPFGGIDFFLQSDMILDSDGRIIFLMPGCAGGGNNSRLVRYNPRTGSIRELLCMPYIVGPGGPPAGFPPEALGMYGANGLHLTRQLRITIDDDVNGGTPGVDFVECYGFSVGIAYTDPFSGHRPEAFRFRVPDEVVERGIALPFPDGTGVDLCTGDGATYYANGNTVGRAKPDLGIDLRLRTTVGGTEVVLSGQMRLSGKNEIVLAPAVLDNTDLANGSASCSIDGQQVNDDNVPYNLSGFFNVLSGIRCIEFLGGSVSAVSDSGAAGYPFLFGLAPRAPFLNPYACAYSNALQYYGPYAFFEVPVFPQMTARDGALLGGDDHHPNGSVWRISPTQAEMLIQSPALNRPRAVAVYPAPDPPITSAAIVLRVDSPVNVLLTDASGRRIGHDAAGSLINDFGEEGAALALGPGGHPRVYAVIDPAPGTYEIEAVGTGDGPYTVRAYRADTALGGALATMTGQTFPGARERLALTLDGDLGVLLRRRCAADWNEDFAITSTDISSFLTAWLASLQAGDLAADFNSDQQVNSTDISAFLVAWLTAVQTGC